MNISGVNIVQLKIIETPKGDIYHCLKNSENIIDSFGEAYFSEVNKNQIKGWNKHRKMKTNFCVCVGEVLFVVYDDRKDSKTYNSFLKVKLSRRNYMRLTISPGLWVAFKGLQKENMILNISDIEHDPEEHIKMPLENIDFNWRVL